MSIKDRLLSMGPSRNNHGVIESEFEKTTFLSRNTIFNIIMHYEREISDNINKSEVNFLDLINKLKKGDWDYVIYKNVTQYMNKINRTIQSLMTPETTNILLKDIRHDLKNLTFSIANSKGSRHALDRAINKIESLSKMKYNPEVQQIKINLLISNTLDLYDNKNIVFIEDKDDRSILTETTLFKSIITQIIENAIDASQEESKIVIQAKSDESDFTIAITDNGPGIQKEILNSVFDEGTTTKKNHEGSGLYIAKQISKKLNLKINIYNNEKSGATATISGSREI
ncbi:sensor histidine kinase [Desulfocurvus sp. DL9XJH121]